MQAARQPVPRYPACAGGYVSLFSSRINGGVSAAKSIISPYSNARRVSALNIHGVFIPAFLRGLAHEDLQNDKQSPFHLMRGVITRCNKWLFGIRLAAGADFFCQCMVRIGNDCTVIVRCDGAGTTHRSRNCGIPVCCTVAWRVTRMPAGYHPRSCVRTPSAAGCRFPHTRHW